MQLKTVWHEQKEMPTRAQLEKQYTNKGKYVGISPSIFGGWHLWFLTRKKLVLTPPSEEQNPIAKEYARKNKAFQVSTFSKN